MTHSKLLIVPGCLPQTPHPLTLQSTGMGEVSKYAQNLTYELQHQIPGTVQRRHNRSRKKSTNARLFTELLNSIPQPTPYP